ncbi:prepilin peptidase [Aureimonas sp. ME7]|uniref:A24 family peptidase n=1 Tax=Aureimonas sp. ME7 TaxID=2744252 RepID=UPI0015F3D3EF|nr:prepilin peptidase [Aureimonas sp. ME7]
MATTVLLLFPAVMILAAVKDLISMTIPNRLTILLTGGFALFVMVGGIPGSQAWLHVAAGICAIAVTFACFAAGWMGGGDAKLIAVVALWIGPSEILLQFLFWMSIGGGLLTVAILVMRACLTANTGIPAVDRLLSADVGVPYGVALGTAGLAVFPAMWAAVPS